MGPQAARHRMLSEPVRHGAADPAAHLSRPLARSGGLLGRRDRRRLRRAVCQPRAARLDDDDGAEVTSIKLVAIASRDAGVSRAGRCFWRQPVVVSPPMLQASTAFFNDVTVSTITVR